jgi:hypothetical protein
MRLLQNKRTERDWTYRIRMFYKKKGEQKSAKRAKAYEDMEGNEEEEIYVGVVKVRLTILGNPMGEYQYDTGDKVYRKDT